MRKNLNKLATLALSGMMVMSMAVPAFAASNFEKVSDFPKVVHTDGKTLAPSTTFEFKVETSPAEGEHKYKVEVNGQEVERTAQTKEGIADALKLTPVTFKPNPDYLGETDGAEGAHFVEKSQVQIDKNAFAGKENGVYVYKLTEENSGYEGVIYSKAEYKVYVFKYQDDAGNDKFATEFVAVKDAENNAISQKVTQINNNYGKHNPPHNPDIPPVTPPGGTVPDPNPNDTTHDVEITKNVVLAGLGDRSKDFDFYVTVKPKNKKAVQKDENNKDIPEMYHVEPVGNSNLGFTALTADVESTGFKVKHGDGIHIYGLTVNDEVIIREGKNEYVMTVKNTSPTDKTYLSAIAPAKDADDNDIENTGAFTLINDKAKVEVENKKAFIAPTGIVMNVAPYAMMLAVAGGLGVVFVNRKKEEE